MASTQPSDDAVVTTAPVLETLVRLASARVSAGRRLRLRFGLEVGGKQKSPRQTTKGILNNSGDPEDALQVLLMAYGNEYVIMLCLIL